MTDKDRILLQEVKRRLPETDKLAKVKQKIIDEQAKQIATLKKITKLQAEYIADLEEEVFDLELDNVI